jgi:signal transduction histidine kinase
MARLGAAALLLLAAVAAPAQEPMRLGAGADQVDAATSLRVLEDAAHALSPAEAALRAAQEGRRMQGDGDSFGRSRSAWWSLLELERGAHPSGAWVLVLRQSLVDQARLYRRHGGEWREVPPVFDATRERVFGGARYFAWGVPLEPGERAGLLLRTETRSLARFPVRLEEAAVHERGERLARTLGGMVIAIPLVVCICILFLWTVSRDTALLPFLGLILFQALGAFWISGMLAEALPMLPRGGLNAFGASFFAVALIFALMHARLFFQLDGTNPRLARLLGACAWVFVAAIALEFAGLTAARVLLNYASMIVLCVLFGISVARWNAGVQYAGVYALAWASFVLSSMLLLGARLGLVHTETSSEAIFVQGSIVSLVFSFAVVGQVRDRDRALNAALEAERAVKRALEAYRQELQQAKDSAERANLARARLFAVANHDLRQPLQSLGIFLELLAREPLAAAAREQVQRMRSAYTSLADFLDALLDLSRLESASSRPVVQDFALGALLERLAAEYREHAVAAGLELRCVPCSAWVRSDQQLLERVVRNLISNALRYTRQGRVLIGCRRAGASVLLQVCDTGPGIPAKDAERIFEEFVQGSGAPTVRGVLGLGLGLAIVKRLCDLLGIGVSLRSSPGRGSAFTLRLPRAAAAPAGAGAVAAAGDRFEGLKVLLVDDEPEVLDALRRLLSSFGARVAAAAAADDAEAVIARERFVPGLLITDLHLAGGASGIDCAARVRARAGGALPVLVLTGDTDAARLAELEASGLPYVHKPVSTADLASAMRRALA